MRLSALAAVAAVAVAGVLLAAGAGGAAGGGGFVFLHQRSPGESSLYVAKADGTGVRRITSPSLRNQASDPVWSPDGSKIAFATSGRPGALVMNADGSHRRPLCNDDSEPLLTLMCASSSKAAPAWSPDGQQIAFALVAVFSHDRGVAIVNADGTGLHFVPGTRKLDISGLDWSPDGRRLALAASYRAPEELPWGLTYRVWVINLDGSGLALLAEDAGATPRWSPDGKTVLFARHDGSGIYTVSATGDSRKLIRKTPKDAFVWSAGWSPDGAEIAFFQNGAPGSELHVFRLLDHRDRVVALHPSICRRPGVGCFDVDWQANAASTTTAATTPAQE